MTSELPASTARPSLCAALGSELPAILQSQYDCLMFGYYTVPNLHWQRNLIMQAYGVRDLARRIGLPVITKNDRGTVRQFMEYCREQGISFPPPNDQAHA